MKRKSRREQNDGSLRKKGEEREAANGVRVCDVSKQISEKKRQMMKKKNQMRRKSK
jgi:hypothetical protein